MCVCCFYQRWSEKMTKGQVEVPPVGSDAWKTFVADAIAKAPAKRTKQEQEAIRIAMTEDR